MHVHWQNPDEIILKKINHTGKNRPYRKKEIIPEKRNHTGKKKSYRENSYNT
jgi:hypothetical protein